MVVPGLGGAMAEYLVAFNEEWVPEHTDEELAAKSAALRPLLDEMREEAQRVLDELVKDNVTEIKLLQEHLHDGLGQLIYDRTGRRPMILPVVVEV